MIRAASRARYVPSGWVHQSIQDSGNASSRRCIEAAGRWETSTQAKCGWVGLSKTTNERSLRPGSRWKLAPSRAQIRECAMRGSSPPHPARLGFPNTHNSRRRACQKRQSSRRRHELAGLRDQFGEFAMKGTLQPHPTLLAFTNIN